MSVDILGTSWDQCRSMVQYSCTSTETRRLVRTDSPGRPPRLSHSSWTMRSLDLADHSFIVRATVGSVCTKGLYLEISWTMLWLDRPSRLRSLSTLYLHTCQVSYHRQLRSLFLYLCYVIRVLVNSLVCWFCISALGLILFQICVCLQVWAQAWSNDCCCDE